MEAFSTLAVMCRVRLELKFQTVILGAGTAAARIAANEEVEAVD